MLANSTLRYWSYRFCSICYRWIPREYSYCPYCGNKKLRKKPKTMECRKNYNSKQYSPEDADRLYERFLQKGYAKDEAMQFVEAITGVSIGMDDEPATVQLTLDQFTMVEKIAVKVRSG